MHQRACLTVFKKICQRAFIFLTARVNHINDTRNIISKMYDKLNKKQNCAAQSSKKIQIKLNLIEFYI